MRFLLIRKWRNSLLPAINAQKSSHLSFNLYCSTPQTRTQSELVEVCNVVSSGVGSLDDLEGTLNQLEVSLSSPLVTQIIDICKNGAPTRRLLRFFLWSRKNLNRNLQDVDFNHAIQVFAERKDLTAMDILISDLSKEGRAMEAQTFSLVAETLVKFGREDEALGIFKHLDKFKCPQDKVTVTAIVNALCAKGHARRAEGVVWHHKDKLYGVEHCIYRSLLYGWAVLKNVKEARRILKEMKSDGIVPDLFCYNTFLSCLCRKNLESNPSGLVPETLNVMMEMRSYEIAPTSISYNILLSCLGRTRRVKESLRILTLMKDSGCSPDWVSYYLVVRVLYLSGRFGKGNQIVDKMNEEGLTPDRKFYYDLIRVLCGVERVNYALELFERMKRSSVGGYGPVYDVLIPKLCRGGQFDKGRELWDEAVGMGVVLTCSNDVLDPSTMTIFKPKRKVEEESIVGISILSTQVQVAKTAVKQKRYKDRNKKKKRKAART